ncbi:transglycosylase SLT domain-containing protein [Niveibacterium sp. SC-1]|uniref:transglycosylase SLT domain-containing protein n=1 Tax=Niveibacterium sp. SC-1 TaxID=3135646 RepID=UPI00311F9FA2
MFNATRVAVVARHAGSFVLHFAHGALVVAGLLVTVFIAVRVGTQGSAGLSFPGFFGSAQAASESGLTAADLEAPAQVADATAVDRLSGDMSRVTDYLARRYKVSRGALEPIVLAAQRVGDSVKLDPLLIIAVMGIESSFNPFAESNFGAQGLMQVVPRFHQDKIDPEAGTHPLLDPAENVRVGATVLREYIRRNGSLVAGLQQYGGALDDPNASYANRVMAERQRLVAAARAAGARLASAN